MTVIAVGCPDVSAPGKAFAKREGDNLVIHCNNTGETWYLTCKDEDWIGEYGNCTARQPLSTGFKSNNFLQEGNP